MVYVSKVSVLCTVVYEDQKDLKISKYGAKFGDVHTSGLKVDQITTYFGLTILCRREFSEMVVAISIKYPSALPKRQR